MTRAKLRRRTFLAARSIPEPETVQIPENTPWLSAEEAAAYMRIGGSKFAEISGAREIASHKIGSRVVYRKAELDRYIEKHIRKAVI